MAPTACDACRTRKVKCDKGSPCAHCRSSGSICRTTNQNSEPRSRVIITKEYEKKIDTMADRLVKIEQLLQRQQGAGISDSANHSTSAASISENNPPIAASPAMQEVEAGYYVHDATHATHSAIASKMVERAVEGSTGAYQSFELAGALNSLKEMVHKIQEPPNATDYVQTEWSGAEASLVLPPTSVEVDKLVDKANNSITLSFSPWLTVALLRERCDRVFKTGGEVSAIGRVYVHGTLRNLCSEYSGLELQSDPSFAKRCEDLAKYFTLHLGKAVNHIPLILPANPETASALAMAAGAAVELCKPHIAQALSSKAASMILSLGYQRASTMDSDSEYDKQAKIVLFWMVYWLDTSFAVRLGRAPMINAYDITVPRFSLGSVLPDSFVDAFNYSTRISALQCKVVEQLYTPLAIQQTVGERCKRAAKLVLDLQDAWDGRNNAPMIYKDDGGHGGLYLLMRQSDAVMHYSTLALVQYADTSAPRGISPALASARKALSLNVEAHTLYKHLPDFIWVGHCHWTLLKAPITPFVVTFGQIIANPSTSDSDLHLLADFVATLRELRRYSEGMVKLYRLCDVFCKVAFLYVQAKAHEAEQELGAQHNDLSANPPQQWFGQPAVNDIDGYLSTIGFLPQSSNTNDVATAFDDNAEFDASFLADWFNGQNSLMGFLEQDIVSFGDADFSGVPGLNGDGIPSGTIYQQPP